MEDYDDRDLEVQIYELELWRIREKYEKKRELADARGLTRLKRIYREVAILCKHEIDHFNDRHI